ncbi:hypothetical protein [Nonlabens xiamenensis]|uniref:hypothetical protein n=1 Tax=Nonlabens xiamenensis TaxID=2341043 RepID=UPI000F614ED3|nr:hypothetical protein [Nonlabens xiamenensis]
MSSLAGKNLAILAYASSLFLYIHLLLFIGVFGIAVIMNQNKGQQFAAFHIRQMFGIAIIAILISVFAELIPTWYIALLIITLMVLIALLGMLSALRDQKDPLPVLGSYFQTWFSFIK